MTLETFSHNVFLGVEIVAFRHVFIFISCTSRVCSCGGSTSVTYVHGLNGKCFSEGLESDDESNRLLVL